MVHGPVAKCGTMVESFIGDFPYILHIK
jgi:hypothetical protein